MRVSPPARERSSRLAPSFASGVLRLPSSAALRHIVLFSSFYVSSRPRCFACVSFPSRLSPPPTACGGICLFAGREMRRAKDSSWAQLGVPLTCPVASLRGVKKFKPTSTSIRPWEWCTQHRVSEAIEQRQGPVGSFVGLDARFSSRQLSPDVLSSKHHGEHRAPSIGRRHRAQHQELSGMMQRRALKPLSSLGTLVAVASSMPPPLPPPT